MKLMAIVTEKGYRDPRWCTAKQLFEKGYHIKAGEHGTICEKWIFEKEKKSKDEHGNVVKEVVQLDRPQVMYFRVFNGAQVEVLDLQNGWNLIRYNGVTGYIHSGNLADSYTVKPAQPTYSTTQAYFDNEESAMDIEIVKIRPFKDHPFKVVDDEKMQDLVESMRNECTPVSTTR